MADPPAADRLFPAIEIRWPSAPDDARLDRLIAEVDEAGPTGVEPRATGARIYFPTVAARDRAIALARAGAPGATVTEVLVPDEHWAERSQAALEPVRVGRILVVPPWAARDDLREAPTDVAIELLPSMGFGTGHHATTRLCLRLLQRQALAGARVLDVGTGSGVLAVAAAKLGAASVLAIDTDADALEAATDTVARNDVLGTVALGQRDITAPSIDLAGRFTLVLANLTGALLTRIASALVAVLAPDGRILASGLLGPERDAVVEAFERAGGQPLDEAEEEGWGAVVVAWRSGPAPAGP